MLALGSLSLIAADAHASLTISQAANQVFGGTQAPIFYNSSADPAATNMADWSHLLTYPETATSTSGRVSLPEGSLTAAANSEYAGSFYTVASTGLTLRDTVTFSGYSSGQTAYLYYQFGTELSGPLYGASNDCSYFTLSTNPNGVGGVTRAIVNYAPTCISLTSALQSSGFYGSCDVSTSTFMSGIINIPIGSSAISIEAHLNVQVALGAAATSTGIDAVGRELGLYLYLATPIGVQFQSGSGVLFSSPVPEPLPATMLIAGLFVLATGRGCKNKIFH
jgi:hypothetical protein